MYSESNSFSFLSMSNSEIFLVKKEHKEIKLDTSSSSSSSSTTLESSDKSRPDIIASKNEFEHHPQPQYHRPEEDQQEEYKKEEKKCETLRSVFGQPQVPEDDDQGFRTPTSSDNKIPETTKCPGAPRKSRSNPSSKRKASSTRAQKSLQLDLSEEVESMFPPTIQDDIGRKTKKAREDHGEDHE